MVANVKALKFISHYRDPGKAITKAKEHIKYMTAPREHHRNTPILFDEKRDFVPRREFFERLEAQPKYGVVIHKWVITLSEQERDELKIDLKQLARDTMARMEIKLNQRLDWVAVIHDDERHPHVHIAIRGWDMEGNRVYFGRPEIQEARKIADQEKARQAEINLGPEKAHQVMERLKQEAERRRQEKQQEPTLDFKGSFAKVLFESFQKMVRQSEIEAEQAKEAARRAAERRARMERERGRGR